MINIEAQRISLFTDKTKCSACYACINICSMNAIVMKKDSQGFMYPEINRSLCIECGMCEKVCNYRKQDNKGNKPKLSYAAILKNQDVLQRSASGGAFMALAECVLDDKGVVFGCAMNFRNGNLFPEHIMVENKKDLISLQGSKYVQSDIGKSFQEAKKFLCAGRQVLFSGTPCQIDGLLGYLGKKYDNLFTIDIICHGVPSIHLFQDYVAYIENRDHCSIMSVNFRNKLNGWGSFLLSLESRDDRGKTSQKVLLFNRSSYYWFFLNGISYRENCYHCKYASEMRISDLTIGDFWGIEKEHPTYLTENGGKLSNQKGVSCVLVNTEQGERWLTCSNRYLDIFPSDFTKVSKHNKQLVSPTNRHPERDNIMELYEANGYDAIEKWYSSYLGLKRYVYIFWDLLPQSIRQIINKARKKY